MNRSALGGRFGSLRAPGRRRPRRGVALVVVLLAITLITAVVVQFSYDAHVDYSLAENEADETRAYGLALSGIEIYKLILTADQKIEGNQAIQQFLQAQGMGQIELWRMIPEVNTAMLRAISSPDVPQDQKEEIQKRFGGIAFDTLGAPGGFLDFDGDFDAKIEDEEGKIDVNAIADERIDQPLDSSIGRQIYAMSIDEKYDPIFDGVNALGERKLPRDEVIGNIIDWVDPNQQAIMGGGAEDSLYADYEPRYQAKNAKFDTLAELQMVRGIDDDFMQAFADKLTVYGDGKININSCDVASIASLILAYADDVVQADVAKKIATEVVKYRGVSPFTKPDDFITLIQESYGIRWRTGPGAANQTPVIKDHITVSSKYFTIRSTGFAGEARTTITAVVDNTAPGSLRFLYWRVD